MTRSEKCSMITLEKMLAKMRVDRTTVVLADVRHDDYPDYSDAWVESAHYTDGTPLSEDQCFALSHEFVLECVGELL